VLVTVTDVVVGVVSVAVTPTAVYEVTAVTVGSGWKDVTPGSCAQNPSSIDVAAAMSCSSPEQPVITFDKRVLCAMLRCSQAHVQSGQPILS
jgi:hypothetical protein